MSGNAKTWKYIRRDAIASILVIPVSLMFAMGLTTVAHVPIESGIIAVVVGGIVVSSFGGSFVNITGPGVHSAAVWMMGVIILGQGRFVQGFQLMLAASVLAGVLMLLVGLARQIHRFDAIPVAVSRGVVTMLGVWIIVRQIPLLFGGDAYKPYASIGQILHTYPEVLKGTVSGNMDYWISGIGLVALLFMIFYSSYQNRLIRTLPAPLWLLIGGIVASIYLQVTNGTQGSFHLQHQLKMENFGLDWLHFPDWTAIQSGKFWAVSVGLFFVAMNESIANLRTVDRLDILHRRTDINREVVALGLATIVSSLIGGMTITATVAQSSTNVQLNGVTRWSNLFNSIGVLLVAVLATPFLEQMIIPVLAAMMLYIGYRMAAPSHIRSIAEIGWEDLTALAVTFAIAWQFGIVYGIVVGVILAFLFQLITSGKPGLILRFVLRPNTLLYQEDGSSYLLSVKHYGNFLNLSRIRQKIDSVPSSSEMTVDFSLSEFVDQNVLRKLDYYEEIFMRRGGRFEVVGIDDLPVRVHHPFSSWMPFGSAPSDSGELSNRQQALADWAEEYGFTYQPNVRYTGQPFYKFRYFRALQIESQKNRIEGELEGLKFVLADIDYHQGEFIARGTLHSTMMSMKITHKVPQFVLDRERLLDKVAALAGFNDVNFDDFPEFSSKFRLQAANEEALREFISKDFVDLLTEYPDYHIEARGNQVLIFEKERLAGANEIKGLVSFAAELAAFLKTDEE